MRKPMSLMLAMAMGISWTGSPVCAEEGNPTAPPAAEQLPGMTPGQDQTANGMQQQVLEGMQAQAAAMQPPDVAPPPVPVAPANPPDVTPPPPVVKPDKDPIDIWIEKNYPKKYQDQIKEQMEKLKEALESLPPPIYTETTNANGEVVIQIKVGDVVIAEIVIYKIKIGPVPIGIGIDISVGEGGPPVITINGGPISTTIKIPPEDGITIKIYPPPKNGDPPKPPVLTLPDGTQIELTPEKIKEMVKAAEEAAQQKAAEKAGNGECAASAADGGLAQTTVEVLDAVLGAVPGGPVVQDVIVPVIQAVSEVIQTLPVLQQLEIMLEAIEAALDYLDPPVLPPGITPDDLQPPVVDEGDLIWSDHTPDLDKPLDIT